MVDPDEPEEDESSEKIKADLDTAQNNIDLFDEMLDSYNPSDGPLEDNDIMTELYQFLNKMRPRLKKLCQDMDEDEDVDGVIPVFRRVDNTLDKYEDIVDGKWDCSQGRADSPRKSNPSPDTRSPQAQQPNIDDLLLDLSDDTAMAAPPMQAQPAAGSILADDDFLSLSMGSGLGSGLV
ncbi:hypothetical protein SARC_12028 [Sphaeroforma arctica JP610]|uniref:GAT domain-containing protein n=1 Tax=Sphaeroforma arctica JP610 TaxID=667725 RepID=A0A0L0FHC2_9EUKA|nr:hypothetical protein SARC_12028 [Sphaeroforma arctica JP610]KNC75448.1 hypothetical protein SARC_12028 [Sphaeroforma arctica JP610]|eukprot:XP_014149350.1 hypothetical protein SARC_12028 [Sphaeroforma arctica JP610]